MFRLNQKYCFMFHRRKLKEEKDENQYDRINLGELVIRQIDAELERKARYDAKTIGYVAVIVFVLTIVAGFIKGILTPVEKESFFAYFISVTLFRKIYIIIAFLICTSTFVYGAILILKCAKVLQVKDTGIWNQTELYETYKKIKQGKVKKINNVVKNSIDINEINVATNENIEKSIKKISKYLMIFIICFIISAGITFVSYMVL